MVLKPRFLHVIAFATVFALFTFPVADSDLGWHLRYGEFALENKQLLRTNQFSWSMPDYDWPNHSWGYDLIAALLFQTGGFLWLSLAGALLIAIVFSLSNANQKPPQLLLSLLVFAYFILKLLNTGLRSQLFSLLFTIILWRQLARPKPLKNHPVPHLDVIITVALFLLWANLHGQFILGLGIFALNLIGSIADKKISLQRLVAFIGAGLITLFNPWGMKLIGTTLSHLNHPLTDNIFEWMPWELTSPHLLLYLVYLVWFWLRYARASTRSFRLGLPLCALALLSLKARRIIPFFLILSLTQLSLLVPKPPKLLQSWSPLLLVVSLFFAFYQLKNRPLFNQTWASYCQTQVLCSEPAVTFLNSRKLTGRIFNAYRLGGHLIYRYPQAKVYIDGRMTLWQDSQGKYPFQTYLDIVHATTQGKIQLQSLSPELVIVHPQFELAAYLEVLGWPKIFTDQVVNIYQNPHESNLTVQ